MPAYILHWNSGCEKYSLCN